MHAAWAGRVHSQGVEQDATPPDSAGIPRMFLACISLRGRYISVMLEDLFQQLSCP